MGKRSYDLLRRMGFTDYEASAYTVLASKTRMTARAISRKTNIPITKAYGVLDSLSERGLIKAYPGRPRLYEANPPDQAVKSFYDYKKTEYKNGLERIKTIGEELSHEIENSYWEKFKIKPEEVMKELPNLDLAEIETTKMIDESQDNIYILTAVFDWIHKVRTQIEGAAHRGVEFKVLLLSPDAKPRNLSKEIKADNFHVKLGSAQWYPMRCTISDQKKALFILWASINKETFWNPILFKPYLTYHPGIVKALSDTFERMWNESDRRWRKTL